MLACQRHKKISQKFPHSEHLIRTTMTVGATMALLIGLNASVSALPFDLPGLSSPRPAPPAQRTVALHTPASTKGKQLAKPEPANELAAKAKGTLQIVISLDKQSLELYSDGAPIAHSRVSTGMRGRATPSGVYSVIQKDRWHRSNLYEDAPMFFMQRITWSGVAMHQGIVPNYPASHGCIRMPEAFAKQMWGTTRVGVRVIISRQETAPVAVSHPSLFVHKAPPPVATLSPQQSLAAAQQAWKLAELTDMQDLAQISIVDAPTAILPTPEVQRPLKAGPVSVFISRKEGKLFVRKGFDPVFDTPITIANPQTPLGTHVFTALTEDENTHAFRWNVVSVNTQSSPTAALDRITIPEEASDRIAEMMSPGSSLIISDHGLGGETGKGTDFIVTNP